jgi:uncharacterized membrane protein required for colicin V production
MMSLDNLPFNWFDVAILVMLLLGIHRGRKHGMSEELMLVLKWVAIAGVCAIAYRPIGEVIASGPVFDLLSGYLMAYICVALLITGAFAMVKRSLGGKLVGSDAFGKSEFYLGMFAGMLRFTCILIAAIALLNARYFSSAEIEKERDYQNNVYGSNFFPTLYSVQAQVFEQSLTGPWIRSQLGFLLIEPTPRHQKEIKRKEFAVP